MVVEQRTTQSEEASHTPCMHTVCGVFEEVPPPERRQEHGLGGRDRDEMCGNR